MPAPKGNQFWKARSKHGRDKIFEDEKVLWDAACEYFQWVEDNPLMSTKVVSYLGDYKLAPVPKMRAMTLNGLFIFLDIDRRTWDLYRQREDFIPVVEKIEKIIITQKFEGASAGLLKENIIVREIGLADKINTEITGKDGAPIITSEMSPKEAAQAFKDQIKGT